MKHNLISTELYYMMSVAPLKSIKEFRTRVLVEVILDNVKKELHVVDYEHDFGLTDGGAECVNAEMIRSFSADMTGDLAGISKYVADVGEAKPLPMKISEINKFFGTSPARLCGVSLQGKNASRDEILSGIRMYNRTNRDNYERYLLILNMQTPRNRTSEISMIDYRLSLSKYSMDSVSINPNHRISRKYNMIYGASISYDPERMVFFSVKPTISEFFNKSLENNGCWEETFCDVHLQNIVNDLNLIIKEDEGKMMKNV